MSHFSLVQANNAVVRTWGQQREEADLRNHVDLVEMLDIVDLDKGVSIAGGPSFSYKIANLSRVNDPEKISPKLQMKAGS